MITPTKEQECWRTGTAYLASVLFALMVLIWAYHDGLGYMVDRWESSEEYGYGYMIPLIVCFFIWTLKDDIERMPFTGSWAGVILLLFGGFLLVLGELATLLIIVQYAFLVALCGFVLAITGWKVFLRLVPILAMLFFMIPLPNFIYQGLSSELQLISSQLGVAVIRLFDISVFLEGNVIDLGQFKLQVVEACAGLRYLFPLTALAYISAYLFKAALWKKVIIFLSSAPITVFMNSFRIGIIGVLVEYYGIEQAEGFLHDFEGWVVFMACMAILIFEMWVLSRIGRESMSLSESFKIDMPIDDNSGCPQRPVGSRYFITLPLLFLVAIVPIIIDNRAEVIPEREKYAGRPVEIPGWQASSQRIGQGAQDVLQFTDHSIADYTRAGNRGAAVNFYTAYYESQRKGASIHSPRSCIPGGGWQIEEHEVASYESSKGPLQYNRLLIKNGSQASLVYYWFDQRGRNLTNEYVVKWYLFWDALKFNRTDGSLLRVISTPGPGESLVDVDRRMQGFIDELLPVIDPYLPDSP